MKRDKTIPLLFFTAVICALTFVGCASVQEKIPIVGERYRVRNEGYSLLVELTDKQRNVDRILIVRNANAKVSAEIKEIAHIFGQARGQLDAFAKKDAALRFQTKYLPTLEQKTRDSIERRTTKDLLFSSDHDFELQLLLSQVQALQYATHLAKELGNQDDATTRKAFLDQFSTECEQHYRKVIQLLSSH